MEHLIIIFEKKTCKIISIGITLFFLCDLNVAFSNISFYLLSIKHVENLENVFLPLIWFLSSKPDIT